MIKTRLPCDYERCASEVCKVRTSCVRHTANNENCYRISMSGGSDCIENQHKYFMSNGLPKPEVKDENK